MVIKQTNKLKRKENRRMKENEMMTYFTGAAVALMSFFAPIVTMLYVVIFVVTLDALVAITRSWCEFIPKSPVWWKRFLSKFSILEASGILKTTLKFIFYVLLLMAVYGAEIVCFGRSVYITNFAAFLIIFGELISIAKNMDILLKTNKFTNTIRKVRKVFENKISDRIGQENNAGNVDDKTTENLNP